MAVEYTQKKFTKRPKKGRPKNRSRAGRPRKITKFVLVKLEEAFSWGCTDTEACLHANISTDILYDYQKINPKFLARKNELKESTTLHARANINKTIRKIEKSGKNPETSKWYLQRKRKSEFSERTEHAVADESILALGDMINNFSNNNHLSLPVAATNNSKRRGITADVPDVYTEECAEKLKKINEAEEEEKK